MQHVDRETGREELETTTASQQSTTANMSILLLLFFPPVRLVCNQSYIADRMSELNHTVDMFAYTPQTIDDASPSALLSQLATPLKWQLDNSAQHAPTMPLGCSRAARQSRTSFGRRQRRRWASTTVLNWRGKTMSISMCVDVAAVAVAAAADLATFCCC